ncbi:hypothetical protein BS47DRAFT_1373898 [Hydnum rufescens UP504]|uniref:Uncharacterized protein n=1 Tax=Hydnum rufescens UP504 TaxID=1448309 RepID=A0A9P6DMZ7_9AGAM|nr:hypothetical protein BS47DRAFT_1373898 [Hydnum rufescens UP504]
MACAWSQLPAKVHVGMHGAMEAHHLREWSHAYIKDPKDLPINPYGTWNVSMLVSDEDLVQDIALHLQSLGQYISTQDIKTISHKTAACWIHIMGYWWGEELKGQYADGHERDDVVTYRQSIFLPAWATLEAKTHKFDNDGSLDALAPLPTCPTVIWNHDESIFYAHDRRKLWWIHSSKTAKPYAKGEGASLMVVDYISPDNSWLREPDGSGPEHGSYFTCDGVLAQVTKAMDLLDQYYPNEDHVFVYDNAVHGPDGKVIKIFTKMVDAKFADGTPQLLYFPNNHPWHPGLFKGMEVILEERGFHNVKSLKPECKGFKCKPATTDCCCHCILFNQPDFTNVKSLLEDLCESQGYTVIFLPKFHPELNFIKMCWGYGNDVLGENALMALESVPLLSM